METANDASPFFWASPLLQPPPPPPPLTPSKRKRRTSSTLLSTSTDTPTAGVVAVAGGGDAAAATNTATQSESRPMRRKKKNDDEENVLTPEQLNQMRVAAISAAKQKNDGSVVARPQGGGNFSKRRGPKCKTNQFRGVTRYRRTGRWEAHIWANSRQIHLGSFEMPADAARAFDRAFIRFRSNSAWSAAAVASDAAPSPATANEEEEQQQHHQGKKPTELPVTTTTTATATAVAAPSSTTTATEEEEQQQQTQQGMKLTRLPSLEKGEYDKIDKELNFPLNEYKTDRLLVEAFTTRMSQKDFVTAVRQGGFGVLQSHDEKKD